MSGRVSYLGGIVKNGLILDLDAGKLDSYNRVGTSWNDISSNGYVGTLINGPIYNSSNGGSVSFDGVDDYGRIPYNSNFNLSNTDYTLEGWFNSNSFSTDYP
jgi:hypothetical protein